MRYFLLPTILVTACAVNAGTQTAPGAVALVCPENPQPAVARLCTSLADALREDGYQLDADAAPVRLLLEAESPRPASLRARLVVERDGSRQTGEQGEVSVVDRRDIPPDQIDSFARALLAHTPLPKP